jgi:hypothetical protein
MTRRKLKMRLGGRLIIPRGVTMHMSLAAELGAMRTIPPGKMPIPVETQMRRPRILLRTFVAIVAATSVGVWWLSIQPRRRAKAIAATNQAGGVVQLDSEYLPNWQPKPRAVVDLTKLSDKWLGAAFAHDLSVVNLDGARISDDQISSLSGITSLRRLYLNGTPITDNAMRHLHGLFGLEFLELRETQIGDAGLPPVRDLRNLRVLFLTETRVGDTGMASLSGLLGLEELRLGHTSVGDAGLAHLTTLASLKELKLNSTRVTDEGLRYLAALRKLEFLDLSNTAVTDAGLKHLSGLKELRLFFLEKTRVSRGGVVALQNTIPSVVVYLD